MALIIQTTGLEQYAPGGTARIKVLNIGGPGAGKTRWASYFPQPIYADCEGGLASVADRKVPFVNIKHSTDMLDLLSFLKQESQQPQAQRTYHTVVIDTLDAFQRKIKNEWMEKEKKQVFTGWEAWGYLNSRMQLLMTRLLNLDMNVIVNVHYKDRTTKDDETGKETHELMLQLQGESADTAFNDFDLVGWTGTYWEAVDGQRVQRRGITFKATPDKPFLKDRLHVTPAWLEIAFADSDYTDLFERIQAKAADIEASEIVGEVPSEVEAPNPMVVAPGAIGTGAIGTVPSGLALTYQQMDKPTLSKMCRDRGLSTTVDGTPIKGNTLKAELIAALEAYDLAPPATAPAPTTEATERSDAPGEGAVAPTRGPKIDPRQAIKGFEASPSVPERGVANPDRARLAAVPEGLVNTSTGELMGSPSPTGEPTHDSAVALVADQLGGVITQDKAIPVPATAAPAVVATQSCDDCGKTLTDDDGDYPKLAYIKFRKRLCEDDFRKRKTAVAR